MSDLEIPYFLAKPAGTPRGGVVVIHEGGGMSTQLLRISERIAREGYVVVAPDLFFRVGGPEAADFATLMGSMADDQTLRDIQFAADVARAHGAAKVGVTGFCMGGRLTYLSAIRGIGFSAAVGFYGGGIAKILGTPTCPTLLMFGGDDPWIKPAEIEAVAAHHPETVVYPTATHGFMRDKSESYSEEAATDAWRRLTAFFAEHIG
ncbi:MAG: dienelactone hydrolase family protein [Acidimicrobiia bacterium]